MRADVFHNFWLSFNDEIHFLIVKILPVTLFMGLVPAFGKPPMTLKVVPKATCDPKNYFKSRP
jgi:hypothetical protein